MFGLAHPLFAKADGPPPASGPIDPATLFTGGILGAAFISVALVLGEYVFASLLHFDTLPVAMAALYKSNGPAAMAAALASMLFVAALLVGLTFLSRDRHKQGAPS